MHCIGWNCKLSIAKQHVFIAGYVILTPYNIPIYSAILPFLYEIKTPFFDFKLVLTDIYYDDIIFNSGRRQPFADTLAPIYPANDIPPNKMS